MYNFLNLNVLSYGHNNFLNMSWLLLKKVSYYCMLYLFEDLTFVVLYQSQFYQNLEYIYSYFSYTFFPPYLSDN